MGRNDSAVLLIEMFGFLLYNSILTYKIKGKTMLKKLRNKKTAKKIWIVLAILILPAFILWGSGSVLRNKEKGESEFAGKVQGRNIPFLEYKDAVSATRNQAIMQFGDDLAKIQKYLNLEDQGWERIIILAEAKRRKINANDKEVIKTINNYPFFQRKNQFDNRLYQEMLRYYFRTQPRVFEEETRQNIALSKLYNQVTEGIKISAEEVKKEYERTNEQLSLYYIAAIPQDFVNEVTASEQEIKDYFGNNNLQFKQPLTYNLEYLSADSKEKINKLLPFLSKKEDFNKLIKEMGLALKETGFFAETAPIPVPEIGWSPEIINLISKARINQYLPPIQMGKTCYLFKVKDKKEPYIPDFENIKDKVKEAFNKHKAEEIAKTKIEECLKKLRQDYQKDPKSADFDKTAKLFGLKSSSTDLFKYGSYIEGIGASDIFWTMATRLLDNEFSEIISLPSGFYVVKSKSRVPIDEKKFKEENTEFTQRLLTMKKQDCFNKFVAELKKNSQRFQ